VPEGPQSDEEQELARLLGQLARVQERQKAPLSAEDRRSQRATLKTWLREHTPLVYATMYDDRLLERLRRAELERLARVRRAALAYCIECRNPLLATEYGFQFCPYARAGQHPKVTAAMRRRNVVAISNSHLLRTQASKLR
jgi:hypothetical protein